MKYFIEVKRSDDMDKPVVQAKKAAAERWARYVSDNGESGVWRYLLVSETVLDIARSFAAVIQHVE